MLGLFEVTDAQIDRAVESYWDRRWEEMNAPDAWENDDPDWDDVYEILDTQYSAKEFCELVRDYLDGNGDLMVELCREGRLEDWIPEEDKWRLEDPDDEWDIVDQTFERYWDSNSFMLELWESELVYKPICEKMLEEANNDGYSAIREKYNESRRK